MTGGADDGAHGLNLNTTVGRPVKGGGVVDVPKNRRSMRPKAVGPSKSLMVRRRVSAVSGRCSHRSGNHEARLVASSFETRRRRRSSG
jgi:hypothetical protein